jgi:hypothetical protein
MPGLREWLLKSELSRRNKSPGCSFCLVGYTNSGNLCDEIQSLAARRFLPRVDYILDREKLDRGPPRPARRRPVRLIMNGWFAHDPGSWPPHPAVRPLLVSMHLSDQMTASGLSAAESLVVGANARWLRQHGPVGARDLWTLDILQTNDIPAWFSGCLTLTLQRPADLERTDSVVLNDVSETVADFVSNRIALPVKRTTHANTHVVSGQRRFQIAESLLREYAQARLVITSRLHCALPCLALGTPVLLIPPSGSSKRFSGLIELVRHCTATELLKCNFDFSLQQPPENPPGWMRLRDRLLNRCRTYVSASIT